MFAKVAAVVLVYFCGFFSGCTGNLCSVLIDLRFNFEALARLRLGIYLNLL